jgi:hypothetical protein
MTSAATVLPVRCSCADSAPVLLLLSSCTSSSSSTTPASASTLSPAASFVLLILRPVAGLAAPAGDCAPFSSRRGDASADCLRSGDCSVVSSPVGIVTISNPSSDGGFSSAAASCAASLSVMGAIRAFPPLRFRFDLVALLPLRSCLRLVPALPPVVSVSSSTSL